MGWTYMAICIWDFVVAPMFFQYFGAGLQWKPLTLESGGMFHTAMGVILGVSAWTRGQEKVAMMRSGPYGGMYGGYGGYGGSYGYGQSPVTPSRYNQPMAPQVPVNLPNRYD